MIAPRPDATTPPPDSLHKATDAFFRPGGLLQKACAGEEFPYETRPQQREMALAVADAIASEAHLAVEAGTGVGKSFAYLVPAIVAACTGEHHALISTYTISLQEQLMRKDIPFLQQHLGIPFKAVLVKGRGNYVCLRRLARSARMGGDLFESRQEEELKRIQAWAARTEEGSLQDMELEPSPYVWSLVCAETGNCLGKKCPEHGRCFFMQARRRVREADVMVVNHHLFFSELSLRSHGSAFLPPYGMAVLDEAHQVENVASEHFGLRLSYNGFTHWLRRLHAQEGNRGLLAVLKDGRAAAEVQRLWEDIDQLYVKVRDWAGFTDEVGQRVVGAPLGLETAVTDRLTVLCDRLRETAARVTDPEIKSELASVTWHGVEMRDGLDAFLRQSLGDHVYWVEREGRRKLQTVLYSAPIEVGPILEQALFAKVPCVIMTSATLAVNGELEYFKGRVGAGECRGLSVGSPFDFARQMRVIVVQNMPDPNKMERFAGEAARAVQQFVLRSRGRAFVLFTSVRLMKAVVERVAEPLTREGLKLLVQGEGLSRHVMLERFRKEPGSVLFGLDSFWMGVDVRGEALSMVIIVRLPFSVPDQPVVKARMDRIRERGGDPFKDFSLPEAVLKFRQGVGRLIRTATDQGEIVILDSRVVEKWYGRAFLTSIPDCPLEIVDA